MTDITVGQNIFHNITVGHCVLHNRHSWRLEQPSHQTLLQVITSYTTDVPVGQNNLHTKHYCRSLCPTKQMLL